jgi:hypothetical protein
MQKQVMRQSAQLPSDFPTLQKWKAFRQHLREELPKVIGLPQFPALRESFVRSTLQVGEDVVVERVDVFVDGEYGIPTFVFRPLIQPKRPMPALVWNPGWPEDKFKGSYQQFAIRMARQGFVVLIPDHAPFGETAYQGEMWLRMTPFMSMGHMLGISQLAMRAAETMRCGEYLRSRADVDARRVAVSGLCQGGMDTWLVAALDDNFCAAAPFCAATTFAIHSTEMATYTANADVSPFPFGILKVCDVQHLHAAIAPRPLMVRANLGDCWWPVSGFGEVEKMSRQVYALYGAEDNLDFRAESHEHNLTGPFADALERFLLRHVGGMK